MFDSLMMTSPTCIPAYGAPGHYLMSSLCRQIKRWRDEERKAAAGIPYEGHLRNPAGCRARARIFIVEAKQARNRLRRVRNALRMRWAQKELMDLSNEVLCLKRKVKQLLPRS